MDKRFPIIEPSILEGICRVVADTVDGLTGTELSKAILDSRMVDINPEMTKWKRLYNSCVEVENRTKCSNNILTLIQISYHPSRFINNKEKFERRRSELNKILSFIGLEFSEKGKFRPVIKSETISDAERRASLLMTKLKDRDVHPDIIKFCKSELLQDNYFHAVFEATKSVADKIRNMAGLTGDGAELIDSTFGINSPILIINDLKSETEISEHKGFANLLKGFFGMFRNTTAHAPKITWVIEERDALDMMSMASLMHRKLDNARKIKY
jgi:uncharacterized protein (TIGR02391 family)